MVLRNRKTIQNLFVLAVMLLVFAVWIMVATGTYSSDTYYMIAEGRNILANGLPKYNAFTWYEGHEVVIQNWLCCVGLALCDKFSPNLGPYWFYGPFAIGVIFCIYLLLRRHIKSTVACALFALSSVAVSCTGMWLDLRAENITVLLIIASCALFEAYTRNKKKYLLVLQAVLMLIEINFHGAMWLLHFCVLLAYAFPSLVPKFYADTRAVDLKDAILCGAGMLAAAFINPYGYRMILYPIYAFQSFAAVPIDEQEAIHMFGPLAWVLLGIFITLAFLVYKRKIGSSQLHICLGFATLACMRVHGSIFAAFIYACVIAVCLGGNAAIEKLDDVISSRDLGILSGLIAGVSCVIIFLWVMLRPSVILPSLQATSDYISAAQSESDTPKNVLSRSILASVIEYGGVTGVFCDGRSEFMNVNLNRCHDLTAEYKMICGGVMTPELIEEYGDLDGYLAANDIYFVLDDPYSPNFLYLIGWIEHSDNWVVALSPGDHILWERID